MKLKHPESKQTIETRPDYAGAYKSQGWVEVKAAKKADEKPKGDS